MAWLGYLKCESWAQPVRRTIQVRIFKGETQYVAECLDLPVVTQAPTLEELVGNVQEAVGLHLDGEDRAELGLAEDPTILVTMEIDTDRHPN